MTVHVVFLRSAQLAWDQSEKFVKIYVQNLDGIDSLPENQIQCSFEDRYAYTNRPSLDNT